MRKEFRNLALLALHRLVVAVVGVALLAEDYLRSPARLLHLHLLTHRLLLHLVCSRGPPELVVLSPLRYPPLRPVFGAPPRLLVYPVVEAPLLRGLHLPFVVYDALRLLGVPRVGYPLVPLPLPRDSVSVYLSLELGEGPVESSFNAVPLIVWALLPDYDVV